MTTKPSDRPDPDDLLRRVKKDAARSRRGKLKIFFGFAPGVGKTYRMLQYARDLVSERRIDAGDVVVGIVETHGRYDTQGLVLGLELLARRKADYRGHMLEEFDLDAALARRPQLILVDELAHTNAPGSRHPKRWQDVEELLDAGIDVLTTLNVQHVESLNDVVSQITKVHVRETVPDSVLDEAESIELIDITPEELLARLQEGKVYLPAQAQRAADHFFQRGILLALRELALRRTAQRVDEDVREFREENRVSATWPTTERILVCVGPAPSSGRLIRATSRMAAGLHCPWVAAYVEPTILGAMGDVDRDRLEVHLRVAESLGATVARLSGENVSETLIGYARKINATRIVIGKPTHSRLRDRIGGSLLDEVVRGSGDIDVHVMGGDDQTRPPRRGGQTDVARAPLSHYGSASLVVAFTLGIAAALRAAMDLPDLEMIFLLSVIVVAIRFGRGPSILAAALGVACYDFFFIPPLYAFSVEDHRYVLTFLMMFGVGFIMSELAGRLRRQERDATARHERTAVLYSLTRELAATHSAAEIAGVAAHLASDVFAARVVVLVPTGADGLEAIGTSTSDATMEARDLGVARWSFAHDELAGLGTDTLPGSRVLCAPLRVGDRRLGIVAMFPIESKPLRSDQREYLDVFCRQVATALERARLFEEARLAALRVRTEEMRSSLLSAVSHDLRTPLASITGAATTLRDNAGLAPETRSELVEAIVEQAERLERLVANLLDMTRLESGAVVLRRDWVPLDEIVGSALTRLETLLAKRSVTVDISDRVPLVLVDPVLLEQLVVNILENSVKYTPADSPIQIIARLKGDTVAIDIADEGPGLAPGTEEKIFEKFFRGSPAGVVGAGLGLAICKGIAEVHGGTISAMNRPGGGAIFQIVIPTGGTPPTISENRHE